MQTNIDTTHVIRLIVLTDSARFIFTRKNDETTSWKELSIEEKK